MIAIVCVDNNNGMLFNHRRQSQDRVLKEHILNLVGSKNLWMSSYSKKQFTDNESPNIIVDEECLDKADNGDYCFVENGNISNYVEKIEKIVLFKWNRNYPADTFFTLDISQWTLEETEEFTGYSHDKITKEIYRK